MQILNFCLRNTAAEFSVYRPSDRLLRRKNDFAGMQQPHISVIKTLPQYAIQNLLQLCGRTQPLDQHHLEKHNVQRHIALL